MKYNQLVGYIKYTKYKCRYRYIMQQLINKNIYIMMVQWNNHSFIINIYNKPPNTKQTQI